MKISDIQYAAWILDAVTNQSKVRMVDDGHESKCFLRGFVGGETDSAVVRITDDFSENEIPFTTLVDWRRRGQIAILR